MNEPVEHSTESGRKQIVASVSPKAHERRPELLKADSVHKLLTVAGLKPCETLEDSAEMLELYFIVHGGRDALADCIPPKRDDGGEYPIGSLGCGYISIASLRSCPFCGDAEEVRPESPPKHPVDPEAAKIESAVWQAAFLYAVKQGEKPKKCTEHAQSMVAEWRSSRP